MSLYGDYIKEHHGDDIIETDHGFATYRFIDIEGKGAVQIVDIYIKPEHRNMDCASQLANEICKQGCRVGCAAMIGTVVPSAKNSTDSLKVLLGYGMKLYSASQDLIVFRKEI